MFLLIIVVLAFLLTLVVKRPEYGILALLIIAGFGPIFDYAVGNAAKFAIIFVFFLVELFYAIKNKYRSNIVILFMSLAILKELFAYVLGVSINSFMMAIYVYVVIFGITFFSYKEIQRKHVDFFKQYAIYIILCLIVQFYRALFDFTFFGLATMDFAGTEFEELYSYGGEQFRPSSLQGCIVYSIEISVFTGLMILKQGINRKNALFLAICSIGTFLTYSRSGLLILVVAAVYSFYKKGKLSILPLLLIGLLGYVLMNIGYETRMEAATSSGEYAWRLGSMMNVLSQISNFDAIKLLFGAGYGLANYVGDSGEAVYYVEDFYLALIVNSGIVTFFAFIVYSLRTVVKGVRKKSIEGFMFIMILLVNILACSLLAYTVQILFWYLSFCILIPKISTEKRIYART